VRDPHRSVFSRATLANGRLWAALAAVMGMLAVAVAWAPARALFDTGVTSPAEWLLAAGIASSIVLIEEARKGVARRI